LGPNHRRVRNGQASRLPISNRDRNLGQKILTDSKLSTSHFLIGQIPASSPSSPCRPSLIWGLTLDARQGILALSGHGFNRAVLPSPLASLPLARLSSSRRLRRACAKSSPCPSLGPSQELLDSYLNGRKQSTSHFLIDIFGACLTRRPPWRVNRSSSSWPSRTSQRAASSPPALSAVEGKPSRRVVPAPKLACAKADCSPLATCHSPRISNRQWSELESPLSYRKQRPANFLIANFRLILTRIRFRIFPASLPPCLLASCTSNRHIPELESLVSHRKQRIGPRSNRHKFAFCKNALLRVVLPLSELSTLDCQLWTTHV
jgi:hypothetical protein